MSTIYERPEARTWADGCGRWHAVVADTPRAYTVAEAAITDELFSREPHTFNGNRDEARDYVALNIVSIPDAGPGLVHFAEYALPDEGVLS